MKADRYDLTSFGNVEKLIEAIDTINKVTDIGFWYVEYSEDGKPNNVYWSDMFRRQLGFEDEQDFPNTMEAWTDIIYASDRERVMTAYNDCLTGGSDYNETYLMRKKTGEYRMFRDKAKMYFDKDGHPLIMIGTCTDVHDRAEAAEISAHQLEMMTDNIKGGLVVKMLTKGLPYKYISSGFAKILGYTADELMVQCGRSFLINVYPADRQLVSETVVDELEKNGACHQDFRLVRRDGSVIWVSDYSKIVTDNNGEKMVYCMLRDITDETKKNLEAQVKRDLYYAALTAESHFNFELDVDDGYIREEIVDKSGHGFLRLSGLSIPAKYDDLGENFIKKFHVEFYSPEDRMSFSCAGIRELYATGKNCHNFEFHIGVSDTFIGGIIMTGINPNNGHLMASVVGTDISRRRRGELRQQTALRIALTTAEKASRAKSNFLTNMSHDIRTPMNAIIGFTSLAAAHIDDREKVEDYLEKIKTSSTHLLALINDVLDMSHIESGKLIIESQEVRLTDLVRELGDIVQSDVRNKKLQMFLDIYNVKDDFVLCDRLRLSQILMNCIGNAIKFTPHMGTIRIGLTQRPCSKEGFGAYEFIVRDTGIGMSPEFLEHIFEPFERERTSTVSGIMGTGLGMAITKNIVEMMDGTVKVNSTQGKGTEFTFTFEFPIVETRALPETAQQETLSISGLKILLVEDNELNREIAETILREAGAKVDTAEDGSVAVKKMRMAEYGRYDLILMDIQMPVMNGYDAAKAIRAAGGAGADIPIIALTANAFDEDKKQAIAAGMNDHIAKPIDLANAMRTINKVIKER